MSDWEIVGNDESKLVEPSTTDWEIAKTEPSSRQGRKEPYLQSAVSAIPRVYEDIARKGMDVIGNIPGYYEQAKTEIPGIFNTLEQHPKHLAAQGFAGVNEMINRLAQLPKGTAEYLANRLNLIPQVVPNAIGAITPKDTTESINQLFGEPKYTGESMLRGMGRNADILYGGGAALSKLDPKGFLKTEKSLASDIMRQHDAIEKRASSNFDYVLDQVEKKGISKLPIDKNMIGELRQFFPKTKQADQLFTEALSGDYKALRKIQTDLFHKGKKSMNSPMESERLRGEEMFEKRDLINESISKHLLNKGEDRLKSYLDTARKDYKTLQDVYYHKKLPSSIRNMVDKDSRKIPNNLAKILSQESNPMRRLREFHPGLENALPRMMLRKNALSTLGKYGIPVSAGALGTYGALKYFGGKDEQ